MDKKRSPTAQDSRDGDFFEEQISEVEDDIQRTDAIIEKTKAIIAQSKKILRSKQGDRK